MRVWLGAAAARDLLFLEDAVARVTRRHEALLTTSGDPTALVAPRARRLGARGSGGVGGYGSGCGLLPKRRLKGAGRKARLDARVSRLDPWLARRPAFLPTLQ